MDCSPPGSSVHGDSPGKNPGVSCHVLLQGIFPTQGSNPDLPHCRWILYHLSHQGSPRILEWVAYPFSRELPNSGIKLGSPALQVDSLPAELPGKLAEISSKCLRFHDLEKVLHRMMCCSPEMEFNVWFCLTAISGKEKFFKNFNTIRWIRRQCCSLAAGSPCIAQEIETSCI